MKLLLDKLDTAVAKGISEVTQEGIQTESDEDFAIRLQEAELRNAGFKP